MRILISLAIIIACFLLGVLVMHIILWLLERAKERRLLQSLLPKDFQVTFVLNDGSGVSIPVTVKADAYADKYAPTATKAGSKFAHWYLDGTPETVAYNMKTKTKKDLTLQAYFTVNRHIVSVQDGSFFIDGLATLDGKAQMGQRIDLVSAGAPEGYVFSKFASDDAVILATQSGGAFFMMPDKPVRVRTAFTAIPKAEEPKVEVPAPVIVQAPAPVVVEEPKVVVLKGFLLREDVFEHVENMGLNISRFPIRPDAKNNGRYTGMPDYLLVNNEVFSHINAYEEIVFNIALRLSPESARLHSIYHNLHHMAYPLGGDWYNLAVDKTFNQKKEVFVIIDDSYDYVISLKKSKELADLEANRAMRAQAECDLRQAVSVAVDKERREYDKLEIERLQGALAEASIPARRTSCSASNPNPSVFLMQQPMQVRETYANMGCPMISNGCARASQFRCLATTAFCQPATVCNTSNDCPMYRDACKLRKQLEMQTSAQNDAKDAKYELRKEVEVLRNQVQKYNETFEANEALTKEVARLHDQIAYQIAKEEDAKQAIEELKQEIANLEALGEQNGALNEEIATLKEELATQEEAFATNAEELKKEIEALQREIENLLQALAEEGIRPLTMDELREEIERLRALINAQAEVQKQAGEIITNLRAEMNKLKACPLVSEDGKVNEEVQNEIAGLREQIAQQTATQESARKLNEELSKQIERLLKQLGLSEDAENDALRAEIEALKAQLGEQGEEARENAEIAELLNEIENLYEQVCDKEEEQAIAVLTEDAVKQAQAELQEKIDALQNEVDALKAKAEGEVALLENSKIEELIAENENLKNQLVSQADQANEALRLEVLSAAQEEANIAIDALKAEIATLQEELDRLRAQLGEYETGNEVSEVLRGEIDGLRTVIETLNTQLDIVNADKDQALKEIEALKEQIQDAKDTADSENEELRQEIEQLQEQIEDGAIQKVMTLSRQDILDHCSEMCNDPRFPVAPRNLEQTDELPDFLLCGERSFALMFEHNDLVFRFILRMDADTARNYSEKHVIERAPAPSSGEWFSVLVDGSFASKQEVYALLEASYFFTYYKFVRQSDDGGTAKDEQEFIEFEIKRAAPDIDACSAIAEQEYQSALERYKARTYSNFILKRKDITAYMRGLGNPEISAVDRPKQPQLPASIKLNGKTFAMLYAIDDGVLMIVRLSPADAKALAENHPEICRASFPKGSHWYHLPIDGAFKSREAVYSVLDSAREFVNQKEQGKTAAQKAMTIKRPE
ncbi:MAG: InlB B-repeat-containing protein [Firmicutes bacterium]|nr:InlB B-repeat-containing protein [Bacillota bacterium]